eukprot:g15785.t1
MAGLRGDVDAFETFAADKSFSSEDFLWLSHFTTLAAAKLPPSSTADLDEPQRADIVVKLRALVEVHGEREQFYFSDPQTKADFLALLPGLDEVRVREFVREIVRETNIQQVVARNASTEREILIALFRSAGGETWYRNDNWDTDAELSTWHGVKVNDRGRVVALLLAENNLQGVIPAELGALDELAHLDLSSNELHGSIPTELETLPKLQRLLLHDNNLTGPVRKTLAKLGLNDDLSGKMRNFMVDLRREADAFEAAAKAKILSAEDFRRLGHATARAERELPPLVASEPDYPQGADVVAKLRALVEVHGTRVQFYFSDPQTKADFQALLPGLVDARLRSFVQQFVQQLDPQPFQYHQQKGVIPQQHALAPTTDLEGGRVVDNNQGVGGHQQAGPHQGKGKGREQVKGGSGGGDGSGMYRGNLQNIVPRHGHLTQGDADNTGMQASPPEGPQLGQAMAEPRVVPAKVSPSTLLPGREIEESLTLMDIAAEGWFGKAEATSLGVFCRDAVEGLKDFVTNVGSIQDFKLFRVDGRDQLKRALQKAIQYVERKCSVSGFAKLAVIEALGGASLASTETYVRNDVTEAVRLHVEVVVEAAKRNLENANQQGRPIQMALQRVAAVQVWHEILALNNRTEFGFNLLNGYREDLAEESRTLNDVWRAFQESMDVESRLARKLDHIQKQVDAGRLFVEEDICPEIFFLVPADTSEWALLGLEEPWRIFTRHMHLFFMCTTFFEELQASMSLWPESLRINLQDECSDPIDIGEPRDFFIKHTAPIKLSILVIQTIGIAAAFLGIPIKGGIPGDISNICDLDNLLDVMEKGLVVAENMYAATEESSQNPEKHQGSTRARNWRRLPRLWTRRKDISSEQPPAPAVAQSRTQECSAQQVMQHYLTMHGVKWRESVHCKLKLAHNTHHGYTYVCKSDPRHEAKWRLREATDRDRVAHCSRYLQFEESMGSPIKSSAGDHPASQSSSTTTSFTTTTRDRNELLEEILAQSLGPNPAKYVSTNHGVELEVQAGALCDEVHRPVTVSPRLRFVECRTEGSGRAPSHEDGCKEEFLAITFVRGPREATFVDEKPAKLRFFLGYVDEFAPGDGSVEVVDDEDIVKHVLETYRPLTSPDGVKDWTVLGHYSVLVPPRGLVDREVWVEIALTHFCIVANGVNTAVVPNIPGYKHDQPSDLPYFTGDMAGVFGMLRRRLKGRSAPPMVRFGNATQEYATFTYYPRIEQTSTAQGNERNVEIGVSGVSVKGGKGKESQAEGFATPEAKRPVLMQTIEREPPSLKSYPDDRQPGGDVFGRNFKEVVRFCLQKNPKERPNCASLLGKKFFKRDLQPDAIVNELLVHVPVVGEGDVGLERQEQGTPAAVLVAEQTTLDAKTGESAQPAKSTAHMYDRGAGHGRQKVAPPDHPAGTTWVWDDGSGVVLKAEEKAQEELQQRKAEQKEENDGFYDEMESIGQSEWNRKTG